MAIFQVGGRKLVFLAGDNYKWNSYNDFKSAFSYLLGKFIFCMKDIQRKYQMLLNLISNSLYCNVYDYLALKMSLRKSAD